MYSQKTQSTHFFVLDSSISSLKKTSLEQQSHDHLRLRSPNPSSRPVSYPTLGRTLQTVSESAITRNHSSPTPCSSSEGPLSSSNQADERTLAEQNSEEEESGAFASLPLDLDTDEMIVGDFDSVPPLKSMNRSQINKIQDSKIENGALLPSASKSDQLRSFFTRRMREEVFGALDHSAAVFGGIQDEDQAVGCCCIVQ